MRSLLFGCFILLWTAAAHCCDNHKRLKILQREFVNWRLVEKPLFAYADRLERFDLQITTKRMQKAVEFLDSLKSIDKVHLSKRDQVDYIIMKDMLETYIEGYKWRDWNYLTPMTWLEGPQRDPSLFVSENFFDTRGGFENYIVRLNKMPRLFREYRTLMDESIRLGRAANIQAMHRVPGQINEILRDSVEESIYNSPFNFDLEDYNMTGPNQEQVRKDIRLRGRDAVKGLLEAYRELRDYIQNIYMNNTRERAGVGALDQGREFYKACLHWYLSLDMTPEEIHDLGVREVARLRARMAEIIKKQGYSGLSIRQYFTDLKKNEDMFFHTEEELIAEYENIITNRIDPVLDKLFKDQPELPIVVKPMPSEGSRGWYTSGSKDGTRPGIFYANTRRVMPKYIMVSLAMHEANPGHHLQGSYELTADLEDFRKVSADGEKFRVPFAFPSYTAYMEGWALYAESLGVDTGIYEKDYELMGYYESEIFRAARLVVDTGLHYFNWTIEEAIQYLTENTAEDLDGIEVEVDRYITWPGQAVAYKIGELRIRKLRQLAEKELGKRFDVRDFHMEVLKNGAVPLRVLEQEVLRWIEAQKTRVDDVFEEGEEDDDCECIGDPPVTPARSTRAATFTFVGKVRCRRYSVPNRSSGGVSVSGTGSSSKQTNGAKDILRCDNFVTLSVPVIAILFLRLYLVVSDINGSGLIRFNVH